MEMKGVEAVEKLETEFPENAPLAG